MTNQLSLVYFPAAVALGALHALEPGHAKALTAAYLIGIKGTKRDSIVLGLSVATTHSLVVIAISAIGLWIGREAFAGEATHWLEMGSGLVAIAIGSWMLWRRLSLKNRIIEHEHHHDSKPVSIQGTTLNGTIEIMDSPLGERMRFISSKPMTDDELLVEIHRKNEPVEKLILEKSPDAQTIYISTTTPSEPHEFTAKILCKDDRQDAVEFSMTELDDHHHHEHAHLDDIAHAKAHAETLPEYTKTGEKPSLGQIILFGAAGGMIPCPASITVMLLALSSGRAGIGIFTVLGFSLGLALALVGIGLMVVSGLSKLSHSDRFSSISKQAPVISASLVIVSGLFALVIAIKN